MLKKEEIERQLLVQEHSKKIQSLNQVVTMTNQTAQNQLKSTKTAFLMQIKQEKDHNKAEQ